VTPLQAKVQEYLDDQGELDRILATGAEQAREIAGKTLAQVYDRVGFLHR
jgi:tryptophanyl-tRNA synthetase